MCARVRVCVCVYVQIRMFRPARRRLLPRARGKENVRPARINFPQPAELGDKADANTARPARIVFGSPWSTDLDAQALADSMMHGEHETTHEHQPQDHAGNTKEGKAAARARSGLQKDGGDDGGRC